MAMQPAATSASPAVTTRWLLATAPEMPAARANGTVSPSDMPMTTSLTTSLAVKCSSTCGRRCRWESGGLLMPIQASLPGSAGDEHRLAVHVAARGCHGDQPETLAPPEGLGWGAR